MSISHKKYGNVLFVNCPGLKVTQVSAWYRAGSVFDPKGKKGLAHMAEHVLLRGTKKQPEALVFFETLENNGILSDAETFKEMTRISYTQQPNKTLVALSLLLDNVLTPHFTDQDLEKEKETLALELMQYVASDAFQTGMELLYGKRHPYTLTVGGDIDEIKKITVEDIHDYKINFQPKEQLNLLIIGDKLEERSLIKEIRDRGAWFKTAPDQPTIKPPTKTDKLVYLVDKRSDDLSELYVFIPTIPLHASIKERMAIVLLIESLAGNLTSALNNKLREENKFLYSTETERDYFENAGYIKIYLVIPKNKVDEVFEIINKIIKEIGSNITEAELNKFRSLYTTRTLQNITDVNVLSSWYGVDMTLKAPIISPTEYLEELKKITLKDIKNCADRYFNREHIAVVLE